ncbi:probable pseudouridine-5'-phosphatase YKL033W-A [Trichomonascus vanleenenianus]|uniref:haloacid dehalogenase superfamily protein n=1 Tax=Trichomonascus vanleenenianus TaxID=2268995 RepID=UPI003ECB5488
MTITKQIKACLFDMDGLLINSEEIYTEVTNEVLAEHGMPNLPWEVKVELQGRPGPDAAKKFLEWSKLPYTPEQLFEITSQKQALKWKNTQFMPGALELLQHLKEAGIPFALATSSHQLNYERKTGHLRHGFDLFGEHIVVGDDKRIPHGRGKPHPDIWLVALESLNTERRKQGLEELTPDDCLVFEDGVPGVRAGRAAGCTVVWVPDQRILNVLGGQETEIIGNQGEILSSLHLLDKAKYGIEKA